MNFDHDELHLSDFRHYVCGFAFTEDGRVLLIRKARPDWQAGLLNGIGGKVEKGETPTGAMMREFEEETDARVPMLFWHPLLTQVCYRYQGIVHYFVCTSDQAVYSASTPEGSDEPLELLELSLVEAAGPVFDLMPVLQLCVTSGLLKR